jgi:hypothetical protein
MSKTYRHEHEILQRPAFVKVTSLGEEEEEQKELESKLH